MISSGPLDFDPPQVDGVEDPAIDPEGWIPLELLRTGIDVVVPLWKEPATDPGERDILTVNFEQPGQTPVKIQNIYRPEDMRPEFRIHIGPEHLLNDGVGELWYDLLDTADNPSKSQRRNLTIDRTPVAVDLEGAKFLNTDIWGYYHCQTTPPIWEGIHIHVPPLTLFRTGDRCEVTWRGYSSLNGSGPEIVGARWGNVRNSLTDKDIREGYPLLVEPYDVHIEPMERESSATVIYRMFRGSRLVGTSEVALVKIDRILPGQEMPCGP
ncbi:MULTISPECIES: hypothetical protein [Pseudomonas]|uniref:hypothetical protein n=1 Tax=Pseudomonas TaxID=286 RepID=UPI000DAF3C61|nr:MULTISPECIES: hypothetical protein [Pseudomonas]MBL0796435.1 hypothetical protein [Pseudomonas sp. B7]MBX8621253.1 hypothetical protein [Pseudomonas glycinae]MBY9026345.1 hypothetical protein [Pseudomonas fluorescens]MBY9030190.1 hypothetical protein [Pseudomonas fluorescens]MBY9038163.1 hypothetical protein [Pseudomonas fluorescens]